MSSYDLIREVIKYTVDANRERVLESINLIASENLMSPLALRLYISDFMHRYAEGKPFKRYYQGTKYIDPLEKMTNELFASHYHASHADIRPVSGTIANAAVFRVLAGPGEKASIAPVQAGAHVSHTKFGTLGALGIIQVELPYDPDSMNVDVDGAVKVIERERPRFLVLGGSVYLFPHPVEELSNAIKSVGGKLVYDAAHVLGLIGGGAWPNPLDRGADVVTGSTHKTFPGPQGGVILFNDKDLYKRVSKTIFPWFISNHHLHRIPATAVTLLELKEYGESYARTIVENARKLAESLAERGFRVLGEHLGYTRSHQVLVDVRDLGGGAKAAKLLEDAGIILNKNLLPWDPPEAVQDPSGLRIGVQEVTRIGMKAGEMEEIAELMARVLIRREDPSSVRKRVKEFRSRYTRIHYCFDPKEYRVETLLDLLS